MKKIGVFFLFFLIMLSYFVFAAEGDVDKAYTCLENEIANKTSESLSLEEAFFSTLALGSKQKMNDKIESERSNQNCWPKSSCTLKDTAHAFLSYDRIGKNTAEIEKYLLTKNSSASDLNWFLQIDIQNHIPSRCNIIYSGQSNQVTIGEDMKISGSGGSCLAPISSGYWLQIRPNCYGTKFQVSCDEEFITSLLYQKSGSSTIYVSSTTHSASSSGTTEEEVNSQCFKSGNSCDYEGTLWSVLALKDEIDVAPFLPYLIALASENQRLLPSSFLYMLTGGDDQFNELENNFKTEGFWQAPNTKYNKFYDTSLALLALQGSSSQNLDISKEYLLGIQTPDGCWNNNNIRDTAFILYSGWPKGVSSGSGGNGSGSGSGLCIPPSGYCSSQFKCLEAGGLVLGLDCPTTSQSCCSLPIEEQSCSQKSGNLCNSNEFCSGTSVSSFEGSCCLGTCQPRASELTQCENLGGLCVSSCNADEKQTSDSCDSPTLVCCIPSSGSQSNLVIWMLVLGILILIVIFGIVFRKKIQIWWFNFKNRRRTGSGSSTPPITTSRPPFPPATRMQPSFRPPQRPQQRRPASKLDQEMEETLKKLRDISK